MKIIIDRINNKKAYTVAYNIPCVLWCIIRTKADKSSNPRHFYDTSSGPFVVISKNHLKKLQRLLYLLNRSDYFFEFYSKPTP